MGLEIQRASMWKRISAWLFDSILMVSVVVLVAYVLSGMLHYDQHNARLNAAYEKHQTQFHVEFGQPEAAEDATDEEKEAYKLRYAEAEEALKSDPEAIEAYGKVSNLVLLIPTISLFVAMLLMEFIIPMLLKNGQTLGKKMFGIAVMRDDGVRITPTMLFVRSILGKCTIEALVPLAIIALFLLGNAGVLGLLALLLLAVLEITLMIRTKTNSMIHDVLCYSVTVDFASQMIFDTEADLIAYKNRIHAEAVENAKY